MRVASLTFLAIGTQGVGSRTRHRLVHLSRKRLQEGVFQNAVHGWGNRFTKDLDHLLKVDGTQVRVELPLFVVRQVIPEGEQMLLPKGFKLLPQ